MSGLGLTFLRRGGQAHPTAGNDYIFSETKGDAEVFRILMEKGVSSDGIGVTIEDLAKVSSVGTWFKSSAIQSFDEFKFFTGITGLSDTAFQYCRSLKYLTLPGNVNSMGWRAFESCSGLEILTILRENLLIAKSNSLLNMAVSDAIYVPDELVESYKTASYWSAFATKFKPLSEYI